MQFELALPGRFAVQHEDVVAVALEVSNRPSPGARDDSSAAERAFQLSGAGRGLCTVHCTVTAPAWRRNAIWL